MTIVYLVALCHICLCAAGPAQTRPLGAMLAVSTIYYAILGPFYWGRFQNSSFLGVYWGDRIPEAALAISLSSLAILSAAIFFSMILPPLNEATSVTRQNDITPKHPSRLTPDGANRWWLVFMILGVGSASYLVFNLFSTFLERITDGRFLLVAYQMSDLLMPAILFSIAITGWHKKQIWVIVGLVAYVAILGFRYKLAFVLGPIFIGVFFPVLKLHGVRVRYYFAAAVVAAIAFSAMTLTRSKFSGIDFSALESVNFEQAMYGLFAETNVLFGLIGVFEEIAGGNYIGWAPVKDTLLELVPRFLIPSRVTGEYLYFSSMRLIAPEALLSGTAFPNVGELLLMGGWPMVILGALVVGFLYALLSRALLRYATGSAMMVNIGHGLLSVLFGYYYFSRGYLPQTFKALLCIVLPYVILAQIRARTLSKRENRLNRTP